MSYPGNESLAPDIQARVLDTFHQTLKLVESDSRKEAELGCDFILRLDPLFEPARWLQDRLSTSTGEIVLDDVKAAIADAKVAKPSTPSDLEDEIEAFEPADLDDETELGDDLDALEPVDALEAADELEPADVLETADEPEPESHPELAATQADTFGRSQEPTPATPEEVLDAPVAALDTESQRRVDELLTEGQGAFDRGEYQSAIDAWSRIFLIDIDHPEANKRIEQARKLKAEAERSIEEAFHDALGRIDRGDLEEGRARLEKVLELQPDHMLAREQLEKLDARSPASEQPAATPRPSGPPPVLDEPDDSPLLDEPPLDAAPELERLATPTDIDAPAAPVPIPKPRPPKKAAGADKKKLLLYAGAGVLMLVLIGGWLLANNWSNIFPNSADTVQAQAQRPDPIELAESLHAQGKTTTAIAQLKRLPPHDALYSQAQALIAQWEAAAQAATEESGPTEADLAEFDALIRQARDAQARGEYLRVDELLSRAAAIQPLDAEASNLKLVADAELEPLRSLLAIFRQGEWEMVLRDLWRLREDMPNNLDVNRLMVDSYYNLGVRELQRGEAAAAAEHFNEALALAGSDADIERNMRFAQTYLDRPEDLLYRIYVKYVPFR